MKYLWFLSTGNKLCQYNLCIIYFLDVLICEKYNCSLSGGGPCYHGYEVCSETIFGTYTTHGNYSCSSSYGIHSVTQKLELRYKGCIYEASIKQYDTFCNQLTNCHVDNPLVHDPNNNYYFCCCGESLCNQNDTFTHPTEVSVYGIDYLTIIVVDLYIWL